MAQDDVIGRPSTGDNNEGRSGDDELVGDEQGYKRGLRKGETCLLRFVVTGARIIPR